MNSSFKVPGMNIIGNLNFESEDNKISCNLNIRNCHRTYGKGFRLIWTIKQVSPTCSKHESKTSKFTTFFNETKKFFEKLTPNSTYEVTIQAENEYGLGSDNRTERIVTLPAKGELLQPTLTTSLKWF